MRHFWMSTLLIITLALPGCGTGQAPNTLYVFAAASLTDAFKEMGALFEAEHPGVTVSFNFGASQQLRGQIEQGARADVFASANTKEMEGAIASGLVAAGSERVFARNRLVVIFPKDNPADIQQLADLARPKLKLVIADTPVPAGQYTLAMLEKMSADPAYGSDFGQRVLANVVSREANIEAVANKVELGEADAAVVYTTNVTRAAAERVGTLMIPDSFNQIATYPIAPLVKAPAPGLAEQWIAFVRSAKGQQVLASYGFISIETTEP
ncbi:MAG: molybdate ABC transporter substrate-binding protein [Roseiflexaceae bacterium]